MCSSDLYEREKVAVSLVLNHCFDRIFLGRARLVGNLVDKHEDAVCEIFVAAADALEAVGYRDKAVGGYKLGQVVIGISAVVLTLIIVKQ